MNSILNQYLRVLILTWFLAAISTSGLAQPKNGDHKVYDENGKLVESGTYKRGKKNGVWLQYETSAGLVIRKTTFDKGVRQGPELVYNKGNGKVREANWYRNDTLHGMRYVYSKTGLLDSILQYRNGRMYGLQRIYKARGRVVLNKMLYVRNDTIVYERLYDNGGELQSIEYFKKGKLDGECRYYNTYYYGRDTSASRICSFRSGLKDGEEREYSSYGVLSSITTWRAGVKHGKSVSYQYGKLISREIEYFNGKKNGIEHSYYYVDSVLYSHTFYQYKMDRRDGLQGEIRANGDTTSKKWYHDGMFDSSVTYQYNKAGKLYMNYRTTLVQRNESGSRYLMQYWIADGVPGYDVHAVSSKEGSESHMNFDGKMTWYYPSAKRQYESWWRDGKRDSLSSGWYENGKSMFVCQLKSEALAARPEIWNEQGVKLKAGTKEYNQIFGDEIARRVQIDARLYDPDKDKIYYVYDESDQIAMEIAEDGMIERSLGWDRNDQTVYSQAEELPMLARTQEGFSEYMLSSVHPEYFWMKNFPDNDSIVVSFVVKGSGYVSGDVNAEHVPKEQSALGSEVERIIATAGPWNPARIGQRPVNYKMQYVLRFSELNAMISGAKETTR